MTAGCGAETLQKYTCWPLIHNAGLGMAERASAPPVQHTEQPPRWLMQLNTCPLTDFTNALLLVLLYVGSSCYSRAWLVLVCWSQSYLTLSLAPPLSCTQCKPVACCVPDRACKAPLPAPKASAVQEIIILRLNIGFLSVCVRRSGVLLMLLAVWSFQSKQLE